MTISLSPVSYTHLINSASFRRLEFMLLTDLVLETVLWMLFTKRGIISVSYTHLDVYKRQLLCWLGLSCTLQRTEHPALRQAGYLMEEHADSAFSLLKSISSLTGMSPEDKARCV